MSDSSLYCSPHQFEPLWPGSTRLPALLEQAQDIVLRAHRLQTTARQITLARLAELVRTMNSYYSNRIEGQSTLPLNIERALHKNISAEPDVARRQRLALAHMEAERELGAAGADVTRALHSDFLRQAHAALYSRLSAADRTTPDGEVVEPGVWRQKEVTVGPHVAPAAKALPAFFARMDEVYARAAGFDRALVATACAHHRAMWLHPFIDGNGRAVRLVTHAALWPVSSGLWSVNRGLARNRDEYYARLADADSPRRGDLDGRGNLSEEGLIRWVEFFLDVTRDQVSFMGSLLQLDAIKARIRALITLWAAQDKSVRIETAPPLYHVFLAGQIERREFQQMTGLGERVARYAMSSLLKRGLLESSSPLGPVRLGLPLAALHVLLPELYPEADWKTERN